MKKPSDPRPASSDPQLREKIIGLGERSFKKSYYPELMLRVAELERFRALLDQSNDAVFLLSLPSGRVIDANDLACRHLGVSAERIREFTHHDFLSAESSQQLEELFAAGVDNATVTAFLRGHTEIPVEVGMKVVELGSDAYAVLVARDISARLKAAAEMKRLTTAVEQASNAVVVTEPDGTIVYANPAFEHFTGYAPGSWKGRSIRGVLAAGSGADALPDIQGAGNDFAGWRGNIEYSRADGLINQAEVSISPVRDDSGRITSLVVIARDITLEVRLEKLVRQRKRMEALGTLAGGIAHDFNNILIPILACSDLIRSHLPDGSRAHEYLDSVVAAAERAREVIRQIRAFSHNDPPELGPVSVRRIVTEIVQLIQTSAPAGIELRLEFLTDKDTILADPSQIYQVLLNLCTNGTQAMEAAGGTLTVSAREVRAAPPSAQESSGSPEGIYLQIDVQDTGPGIPPDVIDNIFDPFFTTRSRTGGTGLGLALVYDIVTKHGGWVLVSSEPGKGALFSVFLPWAA